MFERISKSRENGPNRRSSLDIMVTGISETPEGDYDGGFPGARNAGEAVISIAFMTGNLGMMREYHDGIGRVTQEDIDNFLNSRVGDERGAQQNAERIADEEADFHNI